MGLVGNSMKFNIPFLFIYNVCGFVLQLSATMNVTMVNLITPRVCVTAMKTGMGLAVTLVSVAVTIVCCL